MLYLFSENYNQNINIDDYAASRGMSVSWLSEISKNITGSTPMQFIVGIRINNAQMYLKQQLIPSMRFLRLSDMITSLFQSAFSQAERVFTQRVPKNKEQVLISIMS